MQQYQSQTQMLQQAVQLADPLNFVVIEQMLKKLTRDRAVPWRPGDMFNGWREYKEGQRIIRELEAQCADRWLAMTNAVLQETVVLMGFGLSAKRRELEFANQLRQQDILGQMQLATYERTKALDAKYAEIQAEAAHARQLDLLKVTQVYELEKLQVKHGLDDPVHKAERMKAAIATLTPDLDRIASDPSLTNAVKNQLSRSYLDMIQLIIR